MSFLSKQDRPETTIETPYSGYAESSQLFFDTVHFDSRYHPKEWVVGGEINAMTKAFPFEELKKVRTPLMDQVGGQPITVHFNPQARSTSVTDADGKRCFLSNEGNEALKFLARSESRVHEGSLASRQFVLSPEE